MKKFLKQGISLLELVIVITVMSFLITVIFSAKRLVLSADIANFSTSIMNLESSVGVFVSIYGAFPGDLTNASSYFNDPTVFNGDGNDKIQQSNYEATNALIHLQLAKIIKPQNWDKNDLYQSYQFDSFETGGAFMISREDSSGNMRSGFDYTQQTGNYIKFASGATLDSVILKPKEAYLIDDKIDDGKAFTGKLTEKISLTESENCSDANGNYNASYDEKACLVLYFIDVIRPQ